MKLFTANTTNAGVPVFSPATVDGSPLLTLQRLRILKAIGWKLHLPVRAASSGCDEASVLALTELHESPWRWRTGNHEVLLHAALRGGDRSWQSSQYDLASLECSCFQKAWLTSCDSKCQVTIGTCCAGKLKALRLDWSYKPAMDSLRHLLAQPTKLSRLELRKCALNSELQRFSMLKSLTLSR